MILYLTIGTLGSLIHQSPVRHALAFAVLIASFLWYTCGARSFPGSREGRQANRELARSKLGVIYFGVLLGFGLATQVSTPLFYAGTMAALAEGSLWGALYGLGFGLGRSAPALTGVLLAERGLRPIVIAHAVSTRFQRASRIVGVVISVTALTLFASDALGVGEKAAEKPRGSTPMRIADIELVRSTSLVRRQCKATARRLGYPVPCPTLLPDKAQPTRVVGPSAGSPFAFDFIHPGFGAFSRWAVLSIDFPSDKVESHLVIMASPTSVSPRSFAYLDPSPVENVMIEGAVRFRGRQARWVLVPPTSSSIVGGHTVLLWSRNGHTYGVGFHGKGKLIRALDQAVAEAVRLVEP